MGRYVYLETGFWEVEKMNLGGIDFRGSAEKSNPGRSYFLAPLLFGFSGLKLIVKGLQ